MFLHQFSCGTDHIIAHPWWFWIPTFFLERKWSPIRPPTLQSSWAVPTVESQRKPSSFVSIKHRWTKPHNRTSAVVLDFHVFSRTEVDAYSSYPLCYPLWPCLSFESRSESINLRYQQAPLYPIRCSCRRTMRQFLSNWGSKPQYIAHRLWSLLYKNMVGLLLGLPNRPSTSVLLNAEVSNLLLSHQPAPVTSITILDHVIAHPRWSSCPFLGQNLTPI